MEEATLQEILESTVAVARGLEALQSEHDSILTDFYATEGSEAGTYKLVQGLQLETSLYYNYTHGTRTLKYVN